MGMHFPLSGHLSRFQPSVGSSICRHSHDMGLSRYLFGFCSQLILRWVICPKIRPNVLQTLAHGYCTAVLDIGGTLNEPFSPHSMSSKPVTHRYKSKANPPSKQFRSQHLITTCADVKVLTVYHSYISLAYLKLQIAVP